MTLVEELEATPGYYPSQALEAAGGACRGEERVETLRGEWGGGGVVAVSLNWRL
jgi:hypothetical protein